MELELKGKVALVTGASLGIGRATAMALAQEGAKVAICARRDDLLDEAARTIRKATGSEVLAIKADVTKSEEIEGLVKASAEAFGGVDILVNNAGGAAAVSIEEVDDRHWQDDLDWKLFAAIRTSRLIIPYMKAKRWGRIINITAIGGRNPEARSLPSSVTRAAGIALTKAMSKDLAPHNILVNTICIGTVKSGQRDRAAQRLYPQRSLEEAYGEIGKGIPLGRVGEPEEVANLILFLASERASYITGVAINVDGGASAVV